MPIMIEFSRPLSVEALDPVGGIRLTIEADPAERQALAARLDLVELKSLSADVAVRRVSGGSLYRVGGELSADVVQRCVISGDLLEDHLDEAFEEIYAPEGYEPPEDMDRQDLPEFFDGRDIDIGELAAQILSLSLDPYPRAINAEAELPSVGDAKESDYRRPFEGLAEMLKKQN